MTFFNEISTSPRILQPDMPPIRREKMQTAGSQNDHTTALRAFLFSNAEHIPCIKFL
jgi:hypothetical protein